MAFAATAGVRTLLSWRGGLLDDVAASRHLGGIPVAWLFTQTAPPPTTASRTAHNLMEHFSRIMEMPSDRAGRAPTR